MSEKTAPVFVVATANDISGLPAELLRKGRLDEIFFVDLPGEEERADIVRIHLTKRGRDPAAFDAPGLASVCEDFSGAEIEEAVVSGLYDAFSEGDDLTTEHVARAMSQTVPLARTMAEQMNELRGWSEGRARPANQI